MDFLCRLSQRILNKHAVQQTYNNLNDDPSPDTRKPRTQFLVHLDDSINLSRVVVVDVETRNEINLGKNKK